MKNNVITKSKPVIIAVSIIAFIALLVVANRFLGIQYYLFYFIHNLDDVAEILLKLSISIAVIVLAIAFIKKMYDKFDDNKKESSSDDTNLIVTKKHRKTIIIAALVLLGLLFVSLIVFSSRFYGMYYILHNLEDIFEVLFQLAIVVIVIAFLAVFFKKVWNKI
ncbi:hypothetical protein [Brachyspira pulli]|uniref:hypothetical protein n=1 Tax=Brachyspira pulli TaxID=310721 RepID=UPI003003D51E